jgi:hypothetical protein
MEPKHRVYDCALEFAKEFPELMIKIAEFHPEFFADKSIVRRCIFDPFIKAKLLSVNTDEDTIKKIFEGNKNSNSNELIIFNEHNSNNENIENFTLNLSGHRYIQEEVLGDPVHSSV